MRASPLSTSSCTRPPAGSPQVPRNWTRPGAPAWIRTTIKRRSLRPVNCMTYKLHNLTNRRENGARVRAVYTAAPREEPCSGMEIEKPVGEFIRPAKRATALAFIHGDVWKTGCVGLSLVNSTSVFVWSSAYGGRSRGRRTDQAKPISARDQLQPPTGPRRF
jgi:hypothetical protein